MATTDTATRIAPLDLDADEFHVALQRVSTWIERYLEDPERFPVLPNVKPGQVAGQLPPSPPETAEPLDHILDDYEQVILPGITHWNHPGFMAYFAISASMPGVLAEMLAATLNVNGMLWKTSPSATELEQRALDWLRQMLGLTSGWFGIINDTASISTMLAMAAAREAKPELDVRARGLAGRTDLPTLRVYTSEHAHNSVDKAAITIGIGLDNLVHVPTDAAFAMRADALARLVAEDRARGMLPIAVMATVGTTSTASVDPIPQLVEICRREGMWLHVDASYGGTAAIVPELRHVLDGFEGVDSFVVNPHKWLFTPVDISAMYTRRPDVLRRAFSLVPEFLTTVEQDQVVNLMDYGIQLGRRFRALKLWMVIRAFGVSGLVERLRTHLALAQELAEWVRREPGWELIAPVHFSLVCCRYAPEGKSEAELERLNAAILARVNASGRIYLSHTKLGDRYVIRVAIGNIRTERRHVAEAWALLREAARGVHDEAVKR